MVQLFAKSLTQGPPIYFVIKSSRFQHHSSDVNIKGQIILDLSHPPTKTMTQYMDVPAFTDCTLRRYPLFWASLGKGLKIWQLYIFMAMNTQQCLFLSARNYFYACGTHRNAQKPKKLHVENAQYRLFDFVINYDKTLQTKIEFLYFRYWQFQNVSTFKNQCNKGNVIHFSNAFNWPIRQLFSGK